MSSFHHFSLSSMALTLVLPLVLLFVSPAVSTSRNLIGHQNMKTGFQVTLKHVDSGGNFTKFELLQRAMKRGRKRMERLYAMALAASDASMEAPFMLEMPCKQCFNQPTPIFDPTKSSSFSKLSCSSDLCSALPSSSCTDGSCEYLYTYGDYSSTQGFMATETFTFGKVSVPKVGFGCGLENEGGGFDQGGGLMGLGRGPLSLISQLKEPKFSYCLTSIDSTKTSTLLVGSVASLNTSSQMDSIKTTPLTKNPSSPSFYYLSLEGITVGDTLLPINKSTFALNEDGSGGMIIDSGTTITYLEQSAFDLVKEEFTKQVQLPVDKSDQTGLELCFKVPSDAQSIEVPKLIFHFEDGADLDLPGENYIISDSSGVACLAMGSSLGMSIFGNYQQQNILVVHDLVKETISFVPEKCDQL
ncbi:Aspartic proteinase nepenthesin-1 [Sesamum alatum]|uniref:Aspartic proteinase nepenthesin-1 n=1 Tax=Sesamum alatum TaxID=300844 RepID=A0AAE1YAW7_9LAMI|nr:Aspartic proteinase nepenthesin-1 [Sesamum alatum]